MNKFLQLYVIEQIIAKYLDMSFLFDKRELQYIKGLSEPILTTCKSENSESELNFSLTNVVFWDRNELKGEAITIDGYLSLSFGGNIVINHD